MKQRIKRFIVTLAKLALAAAVLGLFTPTYASHTTRATLYADGSVSCTGADDTSDPDGRVSLTGFDGGVIFVVTLVDAEPNRTYSIAISEEPTCSNPTFYPNVIRTNMNGSGWFQGFYSTSPGSHNLLVNVFTDAAGLSDPRHREIGTVDAVVNVP